MAGSFGFEADKYDISLQIGERCLFPAVREAEDEAMIVADGFSCREQIAQDTDRQALHLAEVMQMALQKDGNEAELPVRGRPEAALAERRKEQPAEGADQRAADAGRAGGCGVRCGEGDAGADER